MSKWSAAGLVLFGVVLGVVGMILAAAGGLLDAKAPPGPNKEWGEFLGDPTLTLLNDGYTNQLRGEFIYIDRSKKAWVARDGLVVDGASIPRPFWSIVGGPLSGQFRNASIVHDEGCTHRTETWQDVHTMFYEACRCGGVPENKAKVMFMAVWHFGPRWEFRTVQEQRMVVGPDGKERPVTVTLKVAQMVAFSDTIPEGLPEKLEKYINEKNPSLEELKETNPKGL